MCYINGIQVSREAFIKWKQDQKALQLMMRVARGFDYGDWPIVRPVNMGASIEIEQAQWGLIPSYVQNSRQLIEFRSKYTTLNARNDNILSSKLYAPAARNGRCLVLSSGFYEYRHVAKIGKKGQPLKAVDKFPYYITVKRPDDQPVFFMAGISQPWTDQDTGETINTFSIITTEANELMAQIHNSKKRMPTILNQEQAEEWLSSDISEQRIQELADTEITSAELSAWTVSKDFLYSSNPEEAFVYSGLPTLISCDQSDI